MDDKGIFYICITSFLGVFTVVFAMLGLLYIGLGSFDTTVVKACEQRGFWQTGQTRIICSVEEVK